MQSKRRSWKDDHYGKPRRRSCNAGKESAAHRRRPTGRLNHLSRLAGYRQLGYHACNETYVKRDVGDSVAVAQCVAQELGHAQLSINSDSYSRADMGFQAVCIGYMLCKKYGVDTQNFAINRIPEKLAGKEPKDIRYELSKTRNAMADIHSRVSDELYKKKQERSKDYER